MTDNKSLILLELIEGFYRVGNIYEIVNLLFSRLHDLIHYHKANIWITESSGWEIIDILEYRTNINNPTLYQKKMISTHSYASKNKWPSKINESLIISAADNIVSDQRYGNHTLRIISGLKDQPVCVIHLHREAKSKPFQNQDAKILERIAIHMAQAVAIDSDFVCLDSSLSPGILVFSNDGKLLFSNQRSKEIAPNYRPGELLKMALQTNLISDLENCCYLQTFTTHPNNLLHWINTGLNSEFCEKQTDYEQRNRVVMIRPFFLRQIIESRLKQSQLSPREFDVALKVIQGLSNAEVASRLYIDETTVKDHLYKIYNKMSVRSRTSLVSRVLNLDKELAGVTGGQKKEYIGEISH